MFFQREYIREAVSMTLGATYRLDLPENGLLCGLVLRITGTTASDLGQAGGSWRIVDYISEIEVILNGATVCKSIAGDMVQAIAFYDQGVPAPDLWVNYGAAVQRAYYIVNFGRFMMDKELGLDLSKFANVELRVTNTGASTTWSDLTISVLAIYLREPAGAGFKGYMRTEEWRSWTTVQDETKYLDIPTEHVLRRIILQAIPPVDSTTSVEDTNMANLMDSIELNLDTGKTKVYDGGLDDLMRSNYFEYGKMLLTGGTLYFDADRGAPIGLGYVHAFAHGIASKDGAVATTFATMKGGNTAFTAVAEGREADDVIQAIFAGLAYFKTAVFRFDYDPDSGLWLNPEARKTVELNIHTQDASTAVGGTNNVILDRLVKY